jgi:DNA-binding NarL/FixJ family response regulator
MALVAALVPDLLFGSRVQASLQAAGHEVLLLSDRDRLTERLSSAGGEAPALLVVDLTDAPIEGAELLESLHASGTLAGTRTLAFYSHVDAHVRGRAQRAGFDLVVPRSRMAREAAQLVGGLL